MVHILNGACEQMFDVAGKTVGYVRDALGDLLNIHKDAEALVNGHSAADTHILNSADSLEFVRFGGKKGVGRFLTAEQVMKECGLTQEQFDEAVQCWGLPSMPLGGVILHPECAIDDW